jgi:GH15 family glucan-1,4-alpha-glucosidase
MVVPVTLKWSWTSATPNMPLRLEDYAMIGDCRSAALVGRDGSIDWLCWPRFDSEACFAALLGGPEHGRWLIAPTEAARVTRGYRDDTLVLDTRFETANGILTLTDFMPPQRNRIDIVRTVKAEGGPVKVYCEWIVRFGYGEIIPWVTRTEKHTLKAVAGPDMVVLHAPVALHGENLKTVGEFELAEGETLSFGLSYRWSHLPEPTPLDPEAALRRTEEFWRKWSSRDEVKGQWSRTLKRSLITLKALTYMPTGGLVAAPTTSLPEQPGGRRNWDYRYCWLRDATLTLLALMNGGHYEEAHAWRDWLLRAAAGSPAQLQIMYGIAGERHLPEVELPWLPGYENSKPVRVGNAAHRQNQLDVYGELSDALHQARSGGIGAVEAGWELQKVSLERLAEIWREPDQGIWEVRSAPQHFTYSRVMAWVAFDRAIKSAETHLLPAPLNQWKVMRREIHEDVCRNGFNRHKNSFVRAYGGSDLDASLLLIPAVGFLPGDDPRVDSTIRAIERELLTDGLVRRYDSEMSADGLPSGEGAFLACSFWLADAYLLAGRRKDAEALFQKLIGLANDVGLLSEEYDVTARRMIGNFPQAFSHLALLNTAFNLSRDVKPMAQRAEKH